MAAFAEYERYDGVGLAGLVKSGHVTPEELLDAAIARVEARNPVVNAVTMPLHDYARRALAAGLPDGPFRGVPFLMKDLTAPVAGVPMTRPGPVCSPVTASSALAIPKSRIFTKSSPEPSSTSIRFAGLRSR